MAEEHDVAIFAQGKAAALDGAAIESNPFDPAALHQFESWNAGFAEGAAEIVPAEAPASKKKGRYDD